MRLAVASDDQINVAERFGAARGFVVYTVRHGLLGRPSYRGIERETRCDCTPDMRATRHQRMIDALGGCDVVIARGMGTQMYDDLVACGFEVALTDVDDAAAAAALYVARTLPERSELGCGRDVRGEGAAGREH